MGRSTSWPNTVTISPVALQRWLWSCPGRVVNRLNVVGRIRAALAKQITRI
jgi:hypothetical protein